MNAYVISWINTIDGEEYYEWEAHTDYHHAQDRKREIAKIEGLKDVEFHTVDVFDVVAQKIEDEAPWVTERTQERG